MRRRTVLITISILLAALVCGLFAELGIFGAKYLGVSTVNKEVLSILSAGKEYLQVYDRVFIDGNAICYDAEQNVIFITQNIDKENWEGNLTASGGRLLFEKNQAFADKQDAIACNTKFKLWYIGDDAYFNCDVVFSGMPVMSLNTLWNLGEEEWGGSMELYDRYRIGNEYQSAAANYHYRGAYSKRYEKKSYKLNLSDEKLSLCGLREDDDWILNALYDDIGLIRNATCYRLWNELTTTNSVDGDRTCECEFVELIVDHEYRGVYLLQDRIDKKKVGVGEGDFLYKQKDWVRPADENDVRGQEYNAAFDTKWPNEFEDDKAKRASKWHMREFMKKTYYADKSEASYDELLDEIYLDNAADYLVFTLVLYAGDNLYKNSYFGAIRQADGHYKFYEIPWDLNSTFGLFRGYKMETQRSTDADCWSYVGETLYKKNPTAFGKVIEERYVLLRNSVLSEENMKGIANEYIDYTIRTGGYARNVEKYPWFESHSADLEYEAIWNKDEMMNFIDERMAFLDTYMEKVGRGEIDLSENAE